MAQLKMYWLTENDLPELTLPEGYEFVNYKGPEDWHVWNECIRTGDPLSPEEEAANFKREIFDFKEIVPERDVWFLDHNGEHVATVTNFIWDSGIGDMHWVGVRPDHRGLGLSKYLSNIVQKTLKERGVPFVSLTTGEGRPWAVKSYLTAGFLPVEYDEGMVERWLKVMDTFGIDELQMLDEEARPFTVLRRKA